jgi:hypothetical protein
MNIYKNKYSFRSLYSFNLIKIQTDLKLWNNENRVKRTPFHRFKSQNARLEVL